MSEVFPRKVPDLFVGRPVILAGRFTGPSGSGETPATIHVKGQVGPGDAEFDIPVRLAGASRSRGSRRRRG